MTANSRLVVWIVDDAESVRKSLAAVLSTASILVRDYGSAGEFLADFSPGEPGCDWPWRSAYVTHRGEVQPCCMIMGADRATLGDVGREAFADVWSGEPYARFREALLTDEPPAVCRGCSAYRRVF